VHDLPSCGTRCFIICCGNLACEAEGGTNFRDILPSLIRTLLGISRAMQISQHISNEEVRNRVGMPVTLVDLISCRRLRWLGHVTRMGDDRLPKQLLFGWLHQR